MFSRKSVLVSLVLGLVPGVISLCAQQADQLRINQIQVIGTHNSYHAGFAPSAAKLWEQKNPRAFGGLDYQHQPLHGAVRQWGSSDRAGCLCRQQGRPLCASRRADDDCCCKSSG